MLRFYENVAMTLKQLEAFYWAATCLNFSVAAERVHLSVSSLSKRIAELEASLGVQLFDRSGRAAELTPQGEQLLPRIRPSCARPRAAAWGCRAAAASASASSAA
jgi:DNA-binding transcriptional LysR family regulator